MPSMLEISPTKYMMLNICTDTVQNDTGANNNVTDKKQLLVTYKDIESYPIGGVKAEDLVIICTGKGILPWLSQEGKCTMVETLYCADVDGTIISSTIVVIQQIQLYQRFTITANINNEKGELNSQKWSTTNHIPNDDDKWTMVP